MVTASIVTYHTPEAELRQVVGCLKASVVKHLYIIDNANSPLTAAQVAGDPFITYLPSDNVGYGAGHNIGIRRAMADNADYHLVLNSDVYWAPGTIERCVARLDADPAVGQLMPKVYYPDGRLQYQCKLIPTPADLLLKRFLPPALKARQMRRFQLEFTGYDHEMNVPYLSGCFMLLRVSALRQVGLFDERFFMYPEDIDLTRRIHEQYVTLYYPEASITHVYAATSRRSLRLFRIHAANMVRYFNKWGWLRDPKRRLYNRRLLQAEAARRP